MELDNDVEFHHGEKLYDDKLGHAKLDPRKRPDHDDNIDDSPLLMDICWIIYEISTENGVVLQKDQVIHVETEAFLKTSLLLREEFKKREPTVHYTTPPLLKKLTTCNIFFFKWLCIFFPN